MYITAITAHDNFTIDIVLNNSKCFIFDIKPYLSGSGLKKLKKLSFFKQVKFDREKLYWDSDHDFPLHCMEIPTEALM